MAAQVMLNPVPRALIAGLFLTPNDAFGVGIRRQPRREFVVRKRIQLLEALDRHRAAAAPPPLFARFVIYLAGAKSRALDFARVDVVRLRQNRRESALGEILQTRSRLFVAQQTFGRNHHQRPPIGAQHLAAQQMIDLRRSRRHAHLNVVFGAQLQIALDARRGVFRPLPFVAVRQKHRQAAKARPFGFAGGDELIDHDLRAVGEIAELRLPNHERARLGRGVAVFESQHRHFGQKRIDDQKRRLFRREIAQRNITAAVALVAHLVVPDRVAMRKSAAPAILPRQADGDFGVEQSRVGEIFGHAPIERRFARRHFRALVDQPRQLAMRLESRRQSRKRPREIAQFFHRRFEAVGLTPIARAELFPIDKLARIDRRDIGVGRLTGVEQGAVVGADFVVFGGRNDSFGGEFFRVDFARARMPRDFAIHQRLRHQRLVLLVVAVAAVAHHIDDNVAPEFLPIIDRHLRREQGGFRIVAAEMHDRRFDHFGDIGAKESRARVGRSRSRESDLVVHDNVHRAAGAIAVRLRQIERFHHHALAGESGVAVDDDRQNKPPRRVAAPILARAHRPLRDRAHDLQMRRVENERQMHRPRRSRVSARKALVIFDIAGAVFHFFRRAFEFAEKFGRRFAENIDEHIEPPAVRHADDGLDDADRPGRAQQAIHQRNQRVAAFERKALLPDIFFVQITFEHLGGAQPLEQAAAGGGVAVGAGASGFDIAPQPFALSGIGNMHKLGDEFAAISAPHRIEQLAQRHPALVAECDIDDGG